MNLEYAKIRLDEWGNWSRDKSLGYPKRAAFFGDVGGKGREYHGDWPAHVEMVDVIVRQMQDVSVRRVVIVHYTQYGSGLEKSTRLWVSWSQYKRLLREGREHVSIELDYAEGSGLSLLKSQQVASAQYG